MSGWSLAQPFGHGRTRQLTFKSGDTAFGFPATTAGASYTATPVNFDFWRLIGCRFTATTDANVASRAYTIQYIGGDNIVRQEDGASVLVTANTTAQVFNGSLNRGTSEWNTGTAVWFPLSGLWWPVGFTLKLNVGSVQAADALGSVRFTFDVAKVQGDGTDEADFIAELQRGA